MKYADDAIDAKVAIALPGTIDADAPAEIQYMPPGSHEITASRGGKPTTVTVNVTPAGADRIAASHRSYIAAANAGTDDLPYFDFNHDDEEASAHPTSFYWGGEDPQQGGIRAKLTWTGAGKAAVIGRNYRRFSPSFYIDDATGEITGAPVNMGGLVNRAAFKRIAPVVSKATESSVVAAEPDFYEAAKVVARARNLDIVDAATVLCRERPDLYENFRAKMLGITPKPARLQASAKFVDEFIIRAEALAQSLDIPEVQAFDILAREQPSLYERYRAHLFGRELTPAVVASVQSRAESSEFFAAAKALASARGIDISDAFSVIAAQRPDLYDSYRAAL